MTVIFCPACMVTRMQRAADIVCRGCWYTLPSVTRTSLKKTDDKTDERRAELRRRLTAGEPVRTITIR